MYLPCKASASPLSALTEQNPASAILVGVDFGLPHFDTELEELGLTVRLKWPNDLLPDGRKAAGLLPRLRLRRARVRWAPVGVGLNGRHRLPPGASALSLPAPLLAARVLRALRSPRQQRVMNRTFGALFIRAAALVGSVRRAPV